MNDVIAPDGTVLPPSPPAPPSPAAPLPSAEIAATRRYLDQARADASGDKYKRDRQAFVNNCRTGTPRRNGCNTLMPRPEMADR